MNKLSSFFLGASLASFFIAVVSRQQKNSRARMFFWVGVALALCAFLGSDYAKDYWVGFYDGLTGN